MKTYAKFTSIAITVLTMFATQAFAWQGWGRSGSSERSPTTEVGYHGDFVRIQVASNNSSGGLGVPFARFSTDGGQTWGNWTNLGGECLGQPTVATSGTNRFNIFVRGSDGAVYHKHGSGFEPSQGWEALGGIIIASPWSYSGNGGKVTVCGRGTDDYNYCNTSQL